MIRGYKQTDVGVIPEAWEVRSIGEMFQLNNGCAFKPEDWKQSGTPIIRIQNLNDPDASFNYSQAPVAERNRVEAGDLLFAWSGTIGTSFGARVWAGPSGVLNQHIFKVLMDERKITLPFSLLVFARVEEDIAKQAHGFKASFVHVKKSDLVKVKLPVPPPPEQRAIAEALSDVDAVLDALDGLIAKKRNLKQAAMQQLLTGNIRLPGFHGKWALLNLADSSTLKARIGWQGLTTAEYLESGPYYLVTGTDFLDGRIGWSSCHFVAAERYNQDRNIQLRHKDILLTKDGTIGKVAFIDHLPGPGTLNSGVFVVRPKDGAYDPKFFFYVLTSRIFDDFLTKLQAGSTISHLYQKDFVSFSFLAPVTIGEQTAIAELLGDMDVELAGLEKRREKTRTLKQGMMQELLTGKTRLI